MVDLLFSHVGLSADARDENSARPVGRDASPRLSTRLRSRSEREQRSRRHDASARPRRDDGACAKR